MYRFPIGVMLDSFRLGTKEAIETAAAIGAQGIQLYATRGEFAPEHFTLEKKKQLMEMMDANGLRFSALCGDFGFGFADKDRNPELIEKSKRVLANALDVGTNIVTTHIGVVPEDSRSETYQVMQEACYALAEFADHNGAHFAVETGPETALVLKGFLDGLHSKGVAVNLDPANFVMVSGDDPVEAVYTLKDYIVHTHAKDGVKLTSQSAKSLYGEIEKAIQEGKAFQEMPLGKGGVDFPRYLKALDEIGYQGYLTVEREVGDDPVGDIRFAVEFLSELMEK